MEPISSREEPASRFESLVAAYKSEEIDFALYTEDPEYRSTVLSRVDLDTIPSGTRATFFSRPEFQQYYIKSSRSMVYDNYKELFVVGQTCGKCGSKNTSAYVGPSTRSGDEAKTEGYTCRSCHYSKKG
jgi:hypothetical protein